MKDDKKKVDMDLIRDALADYYNFYKKKIGQSYTWETVSKEIDTYLTKIGKRALAIDGEILRKFAIGIPKENGRMHRQDIKYESSKEAVIAFVSDTRNKVSSFDLDDFDFDTSAPVYLNKYFLEQATQKKHLTSEYLDGHYYGRSSDGATMYYFVIEESGKEGVFSSSLTIESPAQHKRRGERVSLRSTDCLSYKGWSVVTPEDMLLFVAKNDDGENNVVASIGVDSRIYENEKANHLIFYSHSRPILVNEDHQDVHGSFIESEWLSSSLSNLLFLNRNK